MTGEGDGPPLLRVEELTKRYGSAIALDGVSLSIRPGEFFALLGPSGCGKTTLMRLIAGLEHPDSGRVFINGEDVTAVPAHRRQTNMMFQSYALFPHLSVARNIGFGLVQARAPKAEIASRVEELLRLVQLEGLGSRKPAQLSGGQRQRVALARAIARRPQLILLDEPLAALDRKLREETQFELRDLQSTLGAAFILVTHDQAEAMAMAERIGVMRDGRIVQIGDPRRIYERPLDRWVASFIGEANLFDVILVGRAGSLLQLRGQHGESFEIAADERQIALGERVTLVLRPERVRIESREAAGSFAQGEVADLSYRGDATLWRVRLASGATIRVSQPNLAPSPSAPGPGARVWLSCAPDAGRLLAR